jgi:GntR family transcriptional regulator of arabinose operon
MSYKYLQIEEYIKEQIFTGGFGKGEKISSEAELSKQFNVSRQTIRTAISNLVKSGLLYTVQGKGIFVADGRQGKAGTNLIGFATMRFSDYNIFPKIITGINSRTMLKGYSLVVGETQNTIEGEFCCLKGFLEKGVEALIVDPCKSVLPTPNLDIYKEFERRGIPVIFYNGYRADLDYSYVVADDQLGGYMAAKHLLDYGHRKISGIFKLDDIQAHKRFQGFAMAFREYGVPIPEEVIFWFSTEDYKYFWNDSNEESSRLDDLIMDKISDSTAMVAYNDYIAVKILKLLQKHKIKFPEEFSLVSFDDTDLTSFSSVAITSIKHPSMAMGEKLGESVLDLLTNTTKRIRQVLPTEIIIRESTKPVLE